MSRHPVHIRVTGFFNGHILVIVKKTYHFIGVD